MKLETAPRVEYGDDEDDPINCPLCEGELTYVKYEHDTVCIECGHVRGAQQSRGQRTRTSVWEEWWEHRRTSDEYEGWYGENRIRMVGGFRSSY